MYLGEHKASHQSSEATTCCDFGCKDYLEQLYNSTCLFSLQKTLWLFIQTPSFEQTS